MAKIRVTNPKYVIDARLKTNYFKLRNTGGPKGDQGPKGDTGEITVGSTTTGAPGSNAQVTNSGTSTDAILNFIIPRGDKGDKGDTGATGAAATIAVGSTTTGNPGTNASVVNAGTASAAVLNFIIPKGAKGDTGATGTAATVAVGATTTGAAGTNASVTNSGTSSAAVFDFIIPRGDTGSQGPKGDTGKVSSTYVQSLPASGSENTFYLVDRDIETQTAAGDFIQINNPNNYGDMSLTQLDGNATQQTYSGKNMFSGFGTLATGSTYTADTGTIVMTQSSTNSSYDIPVTASTAYYLNFTTGNQTRIYIREYDSGGTMVANLTKYAPTGFTTTATTVKAVIYFSPSTSEAFPVTVKEIQLEKGSAPTSFEKYTAGPAPNPSYPQAIETVTGGQTVSVTGKNLLNAQKVVADSDNTQTYISSDGEWIHFKTSALAMIITNPIQTQGARTLTAIIKSATSDTNIVNFVAYYTDGTFGTLGTLTTTDTSEHTLTVTSDASKTLDYLKTNNTWSREAFLKIAGSQLEVGSTATAYTPYQGQSYEVNLGKNLFDKDNYNLFNGYLNGDPTGTITANASNDIFYIACQPNTTYTISKTASKNFAVASSAVVPSAGSAFTSRVSANSLASATITTDATAQYLLIWARNGNISGEITMQEVLDTLQIERGSQATSYASYITPIELAKIGTYQDYIWNDGGTWKIHKEIGKLVLDGTEVNIGPYPYGTNSYLLSNTGAAVAYTTVTLAISDHFIGVPYDSRTQSLQNMIYTDGGTIGQIDIRNTSWTSLADFKTWLGANRPSIYFVLLTPTDTEITDATLLAQLNTISGLYQGVNNISLVPSAGAQGTMTIGYREYDQYNKCHVYIWNDDLGDWQVIVP